MPPRLDVLILGAGASGLAAASDLVRAGRSVAVLEARGRCGGRILTRRDAASPLPIELGAEFVHGAAPEVMELAAVARRCVVELPDRHWLLHGGERRDMESFWRELDRAMQRLGTGRDRPLAAALDSVRLRRELRDLLLGFVEGYHGADPDRVSSRWLAAGAGDVDHRQFRVLDGYDTLIDRLAQDVPATALHLHTVATGIEWRRGEATVRARAAVGTALRSFRSRAVVCTLPVGVLQAPDGAEGALRFSPDLPDVRRALAGLAPGQISKTVLVFRDRFWAEAERGRRGGAPALPGLNFAHAFDRPLPTVWTELPAITPVLATWAGANAATRLLAASADARLELLLDELARMLGRRRERLRDQLLTWHHHDWRADPYSRGAYAYVVAGGMRAPERLARPVDGTLFFAGEATDLERMGTVAGALGSGRRAAREVHEALR